MPGEILLPPNYRSIQGSLIFLAGPIQGAPKWHNKAIQLIQKIDSEIHIASPSRRVDEIYLNENPTSFIRNSNQEGWEQVDWESFYLDRAAKEGVILFWFPVEEEHFCERAYAQTSRYEWGEWTTKHKQTKCRIVAGIQEGFSGEKYIRYRASKELPNIKIYSCLEDVCSSAVLDVRLR